MGLSTKEASTLEQGTVLCCQSPTTGDFFHFTVTSPRGMGKGNVGIFTYDSHTKDFVMNPDEESEYHIPLHLIQHPKSDLSCHKRIGRRKVI